MMSIENRPEFAEPPVVEMALAVELEWAIGFRAVDLGSVAAAWADQLPAVKELETLPLMLDPSPNLDDVELMLMEDINRTPRLWLQNEAGSRVVQIQQNRLTVNWRKQASEDDAYPRYEAIRGYLSDAWDRLSAVVASLGHDMPQPLLCEVLYVNHIGPLHGWRSVADTSSLVSLWNDTASRDFLPDKHHASFSLHMHLPDLPESKFGWLNFDGFTADLDDAQMLIFNVISRGDPLSDDFEGALGFMDIAHEWAVRGFASVTTPRAHELWRRTQ